MDENEEAFASMEQLAQVHSRPPARGIIERCRAATPNLACVVEEWALCYEVASLESRYDDESWFLRGKAQALREDLPRIVARAEEGQGKPPRSRLRKLSELLGPAEPEDNPRNCVDNPPPAR